ncbi:glutathione S-transferase 2 [Thecamonas trahens ATCC 50062]|uniref:Glutathione S-transferase 2 n=1 Tax=Thecamonas trahens ATCC 50062 TaxID=461836 RepID=A0A0L0DCC8_THETB|nr:glutathione S-transferase 2 [Thecamonas trahens ATCC 50062]KNC49741.1 glutathione S-transferase 2 [Thecamonas trahens ATCC 50062]|eukprot:XP_013757528.1 glutathione S-transferase 2 [Thecamonas trahens ATCC 50062]
MSTTKPKLTYFPHAGRAGAIRDVLADGGVEFDDIRIPFPEFAELKPSLPYGSLPVLEIDGTDYAQSNAILRYAGKLTGAYPEDPVAALMVDELLDATEDIVNMLAPSMRESDEEKKLAMRAVLMAGPLPTALALLEKRIARNTASVYAVGAAKTVADYKMKLLVALLTSGNVDGVPTDVINADSHPATTALVAAMSS